MNQVKQQKINVVATSHGTDVKSRDFVDTETQHFVDSGSQYFVHSYRRLPFERRWQQPTTDNQGPRACLLPAP
ncbi:MAG: hypothetical protein ACTICQ_14545, partial [Glutamicibacter arilaitensis]|uniref:hypothetical protein n=1 Tax=Glutamicibacter arilaitensis TaxID=256701 RepID=UPI003FB7A243